MIGKFCVLVIVFLFLINMFGCSSAKNTIKKNDNVTLTKNYYNSESSHLLIKIPSGWNKIKDNSEKLFDFWIVSPQKKSSIVFIPITIENKLNNKEDVINFLNESNKKIKRSSKDNFVLLEEIKLQKVNNLFVKGFIYKEGANIKRTIVLGNGKRFYESLAYFNKNYNPTNDEVKNLFKLQNLVLSTVEIK